MLRQLLVAGAVRLVNIIIHALVMTIVVRAAQAASVHRESHPSLFLMAVMIPTVSIFMITQECAGCRFALHGGFTVEVAVASA
jgi:hypothetical protein